MTGRHRRTTVVDKQWITPRMVRIRLGGLGEYLDTGTDSHIALYFYPPEAVVPPEFSADHLNDLHDFASPQVRRYTVRGFDPVTHTVDVDFVIHEPAGLAAAWARDAVIGDELLWWGPTDSWTPPPQARTVLLIADETGLPAAARILSALPDGVRAQVVALVTDQADERYLDDPRVTWIHRGPARGVVPDAFHRALGRIVTETSGDLALWAGVEFADAGAVRRSFLGTDGPLTKDDTNITSYWIHGQAQDSRPDARNRRRNLANRAADPERAATWIRAGLSQ